MPLSQTKLDSGWKFDLILFTPIGKVSERQLAAECLVPVDVLNQLLDLLRRSASRIDAADQAAHAGAGDQVHRHMVLVEPLQHANVRQAERTAPFEHQADFLSGFLGMKVDGQEDRKSIAVAARRFDP